MTYGDVKREVLKLIFSDTIAGSEIPSTYNNQADYIKMIPQLVDSAQMDIATRAKKIPAMVPLDSLEHEESGGFTVYTLPDNCLDVMHGGLVRSYTNEFGIPEMTRFHHYRFYGNKLYVPNKVRGEFNLEYWRYPESVGADPEESLKLDNTPDTHQAIPFYVAAHLLLYDDAFRYSALRNEYETRIAMLHNPVFVEDSRVEDVYGGFNWGGW